MKRMLMVAGLLGIAAVTTGCGFVGRQETETAAYDVKDKVAALHVTTDSGRIEVIESDRADIHVTENLMWRKTKPETSHDISGDTLELRFTCPGAQVGIGTGCDVSYVVEVPRGLRVKVESDSGTLALKGLSGALEATTDSGTIEAGELTGKSVVGKTDSGTMSFVFAGQPDSVTLSTDSGTSTVKVPKGAYNITTETDSGSENIDIADDPSAPRTIKLSSDSGSLSVSEV